MSEEPEGIRSVEEIKAKIEVLKKAKIECAKRSVFNNEKDIDDRVNMFFYQKAKHKVEALQWVINAPYHDE